MTKIKLCGLSRPRDILAANQLRRNISDLYLLLKANDISHPKGPLN